MQGHQSVNHHLSLSCRKWDSLADQYYIPSVQWINKYTQRITEGQLYMGFIQCRCFVCQWRWTHIATVQSYNFWWHVCKSQFVHCLMGSLILMQVHFHAFQTWMLLSSHCMSRLCLNPLPQNRVERVMNRQVRALDYCEENGKLFKSINYPLKEETTHQH